MARIQIVIGTALASAWLGLATVGAQCALQTIDNPDPAFPPFGSAVAIDRERIVVGAGDSIASAVTPGRVYVFEHLGVTWVQVAALAPVSPTATCLGTSVAVEGDVVVAGARDTAQGLNSGSAQVFERIGGVWTPTATLFASDGQPSDLFGDAVAVDDEWILVGARAEDGGGIQSRGAVYVFERQGSAWVQKQKLLASDPNPLDQFGFSVDIQGPTALIGAPGIFDHPTGGAVYEFQLAGSSWSETQKLVPSFTGSGATSASFGRDVALDGTLAVVAAPLHQAPGADGAAFVFERIGGLWVESVRLTPLGGVTSYAWSVAIGAERCVVGAPFSDFGGTFNTGAVVVYERQAGMFVQTGMLIGTPFEELGEHLDMTASTAVSGAVEFGRATVIGVDVASADCPTAYCTPKPNSLGCTSVAEFLGLPSVSDPSPFYVLAEDVVNGKNGILFYGFSGQTAVPFLGGTLCVLPPLRRTAPVFSGGNQGPADCSGVLMFDVNAHAQSGADPLLTPGATIDAQWWYRDPAHTDGTGVGLTGGLEFTLGD